MARQYSRAAARVPAVLLAAALGAACSYDTSGSPTAPGGPAPVMSADPAPGAGSPQRAADPEDGQRLALPDMTRVVVEIAARHPEALRNSCQDHGGTWEFLDLLVDELRTHDTRWGYNWKRGHVGDPSKDIVDYHWGRGDDEGSTEVYIVDVLAGHCGDRPTPAWIDVTDTTAHHGAIGRWTGRGRF